MSETVSIKFKRCFDYAELTGRKPNIEDFIGENAIFKGEWEVVWHSNAPHPRIYSSEYRTAIDFEESGVSLVRTDELGFVIQRGRIDRIEELPIEIEFKDEICG